MNWLRLLLAASICLIGQTGFALPELIDLENLSLQEIEDLIRTASNDDLGRLYLIKGDIYLAKDLAQAEADFLQAKQFLAADDTAAHAVLNSRRCIADMYYGDMSGALEACNSAVSLAIESGSQFAQAKTLASRSLVHYQAGRLQESTADAQMALQAARFTGDLKVVATQYNNLGLMLQAQGMYKSATSYFRRAIELLAGTEQGTMYYVVSFNLGVSYANLGQFDVAKEFYRPTLEWTRREERYFYELVAIVYTALSDIELGEPETAIAALNEALQRPELMVNRGYKAFVHATLGLAQFRLGDLAAALSSYEEGLVIAKAEPNTFEQRRLVIGYADVLVALGRFAEAEVELADILAQLEQEGSRHFQIKALESLLELRRKQGDVTGSFQVFDKIYAIRDELQLDEIEAELALARAAYEVDRTARELVAAERDAIARNGAIMLLLALGVIGYLYISRRMEVQRSQVQGELARQLEDEVRDRMDQVRASEDARLQMERQLSEAEKLRVLGQLTGGVAHDFNNLLTVVIGAAELLKVGVDDQKREDLLNHIVTAAGSGADITRALMAYARKQPLQMEQVDLAEFLRDRVPLLARTLGGTVSLLLDIQCRKAEVTVDPAQLTSALLNLTLNARDAQSNQGEINVRLRVRDNQAELSVADTGIGMTAEQQEHAIEPFYTTKPENQGNGLGLSMVYGFSKQSGGDLEIQSEAGVGTTVRILLPLASHGMVDVEFTGDVVELESTRVNGGGAGA